MSYCREMDRTVESLTVRGSRISREELYDGLSPVDRKNVTAVAVIGFHDGELVHTFRGEIKGTIIDIPRGENGWGWEPIFVPVGETRTFAEMKEKEKNKISHRFHALSAFEKYLREKGAYTA